MRRKILCISALFLIITIKNQAQQTSPSQNDYGIKNIFPTSPEAAALGRFGDIPVSNYTGTADISIPLYTISEDGIDIPIVLRYQSSGIRVNDEATDVGLGWVLEPGGAIIQVVNGYADGSGSDNAYLNVIEYTRLKFGSIDGALTMGLTDGFTAPGGIAYNGKTGYSDVLNNVAGGAFQPDIYQFSLPGGYSGKFYINPLTQQVEQLDKQSQITFQKIGLDAESQWVVTTLKGTKYYFNAIEQSFNGNPDYVSYTWKLSKIIFTNHKEVDFLYKPSTWIYYSVSESKQTSYPLSDHFPTVPLVISTPNRVITEAKTISQIQTQDLIINFNLVNRTDIPSDTDSVMSKINSIDIISRLSNKKIKSFVFNYDYFTASSIGANENYLGTQVQNETRLKLESLQEIGYNSSGDSIYNSPYQFYYNEKEQLPAKSSYACDYWGYYNGFDGVSFLPDLTYFYYADATLGDTASMTESEEFNSFPTSSTTESLLESTNQYFPYEAITYGGNRGSRMVDTSKVSTDMLNKIVYPTKGYSVFNYESNNFSGYDYLDKNKYDSLSTNYSAFTLPDGQNKSSGTFEVGRRKTITFSLYFGGGITKVDFDSLDYATITLVKIPKIGGGATVLNTWNLQQSYHKTYDSLGYVTFNVSYDFPGDTTVKYVLSTNLPSDLARPNGNQSQYNPSVSATFFYYQIPVLSPKDMVSYGAGVRIASIKNYDNTGRFLTGKLYKYIGDNAKTSGLLMSPLQFYIVRPIYAEYCVPGVSAGENGTSSDLDCISGANDVWWVSSQSEIPFSNAAQGNIVGYSRVEVDEIDSTNLENNGKEVYYYNNTPSQTLLDAPPVDNPLNGLLQKEDVYNKSGGLLTETNYSYSLLNSSSFTGIKAFYNEIYNNGIYISPNYSYWLIYYPVNMFWYQLSQKKATEYAGSHSMTTTEEYSFNSIGQTTRTDITNSKGTSESAIYTYPNDTSGANSSLCINNGLYENLLFQRNLVNNGEISRTAIDYTQAATGEIVKSDIMQSFNGQPYFKAISFDNYGQFARLQQYTEKGLTSSILWGYNNQYPVAKVVGDNYANVLGIASISGINPSSANDSQLQTSLNLLSTYYKTYPPVQVTTYTYAPLIGMTSETDPKGYTIYYEYDSFGRLMDAKDKDGNVVKKYDYHYQGQ